VSPLGPFRDGNAIKGGAGYNYGEKVDLSKGYWNPKRNMWVTTHFSEIINHPLKYKECMAISFQI